MHIDMRITILQGLRGNDRKSATEELSDSESL